MTVTSWSLPSRIWLSWVCAFRVLFDRQFAAQVAALREATQHAESLPPPAPRARVPSSAVSVPAASASSPGAGSGPEAPAANGALQLLALLQREGRLIDFLEQDVAAFADAEIGAAARVVHEGCRRALRGHARVVSVRSESEGARLTLEQARADVKLVGNLGGSAPYRGVLRHRGWRVEGLALPTLIGAHDPQIVAQAELEL
jgi:Domain of unknown function (DUF2760)